MISISVVLRHQNCVMSFLDGDRSYIQVILVSLKQYRKYEQIIKPTITVLRLLLCNQRAVETFEKLFPEV